MSSSITGQEQPINPNLPALKLLFLAKIPLASYQLPSSFCIIFYTSNLVNSLFSEVALITIRRRHRSKTHKKNFYYTTVIVNNLVFA